MVSDTIAAIATALSSSGIGIVRISGDNAFDVINRIFKSADGKKITADDSHTIHYGHIVNNRDVIDEVLVMVMAGPRSYTAEDTVEINCHGGVLVVRRVLDAVLQNGARAAEAGEFTKRAFLNGRIDLSQAEAVIELINSKNDYARKSSLRQIDGEVSAVVKGLREDILYEIAFIESALDDPEHISLEGYPEKLKKKVIDINKRIERLISSAENGRIIKEGIKTVIIGKPNAGKSSLLNLLLGEERAIVTDIAGTTRDALEENIMLDGISLNIVDTAGIRESQDVIEQIGVKKAYDYARDADLILYVIDSSDKIDDSDKKILESVKEKNVIVIMNKTDLKPAGDCGNKEILSDSCKIDFSAKTGEGYENLINEIKRRFLNGNIDFNDEVYITNARHKNLLTESYNSLNQVILSIESGMPEDFFSIDLMNAYTKLGLIIGESVEDDLVNEIFSRFCMGK